METKRAAGQDVTYPCSSPELRYLPLPAEAANALFQVISQRYMKTSINFTTNHGIGSLCEILGDTTVAAAMLDRLLHRSVVINLEGESYRLREHQPKTNNSVTPPQETEHHSSDPHTK